MSTNTDDTFNQLCFHSGRWHILGGCLRIFIVQQRTSPCQYHPQSITVTQAKQTTPKIVKWRKVKFVLVAGHISACGMFEIKKLNVRQVVKPS